MNKKAVSICRLIPQALNLSVNEIASLIGVPRYTFLNWQTKHRRVAPFGWERMMLAFGVSESDDCVRDIHGKRYQSGFSEFWREKALPFLASIMSKPNGSIPSWQDNEANLLKALLLAAKNKGQLPISANVIRRALLNAAKELNLEKEWEKEALHLGVKDIRYEISPVDLDSHDLPSVSVRSRDWSINAPTVPVSALSPCGQEYEDEAKKRPNPIGKEFDSTPKRGKKK